MNSFEAMHCDTNVIYNISVYEGKFTVIKKSKLPISEMGVMKYIAFEKRIKSLFHKQNIPENFSEFPIYKHFKGDYYFFKGIGYCYEEECDYVIYIQQKSGKIFIREYSDFFKVIKRENYSGKRFKRINKIKNIKRKSFSTSGDFEFRHTACNGKRLHDISLTNTKKRLNNIFSFIGIKNCKFDEWNGKIGSLDYNNVDVIFNKNIISYNCEFIIEITFKSNEYCYSSDPKIEFKMFPVNNRYTLRDFKLSYIPRGENK